MSLLNRADQRDLLPLVQAEGLGMSWAILLATTAEIVCTKRQYSARQRLSGLTNDCNANGFVID